MSLPAWLILFIVGQSAKAAAGAGPPVMLSHRRVFSPNLSFALCSQSGSGRITGRASRPRNRKTRPGSSLADAPLPWAQRKFQMISCRCGSNSSALSSAPRFRAFLNRVPVAAYYGIGVAVASEQFVHRIPFEFAPRANRKSQGESGLPARGLASFSVRLDGRSQTAVQQRADLETSSRAASLEVSRLPVP